VEVTMAHVAEWKREEIKDLKELLASSMIVGLADLGGIPATQMTGMRAGLRENSTTLRVARTTIMRRTLDELVGDRPELDKLKDHMGHRQIGLVLSGENPFKLYLQMEQTKTAAPAKGGELAPEDIVVQKGPTAFKAGPLVGELQMAGLPAAIEKGKIVIRKKHVAVKAGEEISGKMAQALTKLDIHPLTVGLDLMAVWSEGTIFDKQTLSLDPAQFYGELQQAIRSAHNLALNAAITVPGVMPQLIAKAHSEAFALALKANVLNAATLAPMLGKAHVGMLAIAGLLKAEALDEDLSGALADRASTPAPAPAVDSSAAPAKESDEEEEEEEEDEEVSEEDALSGLSSLFG